MQRYNGSFGLWGSDSDEEYWLTAYVTDFLLRAREQGYSVPDEALKKASERLLRYLQDRQLIDVYYSEDSEHMRFAVQAYAGYVLARSQQAPLGSLRALAERHSEARSGLPLAHLAVALQLMGDQPRADTLLQVALSHEFKSERYYWYGDYGSRLRDDALIYALLEEHDLAKAQRDSWLFRLSDDLAGNEYLSTQERNAVFLAGRRLLNQPEGDWQAELKAAGLVQALNREQPTLKLEGASLQAPLSVQSLGSETLYQQFSLSGYPRELPPASGENLSIFREYLGMDGKPLALDNLSSGELVLVHLIVEAKERVPDALLVDLLPAGLELENQNLAQSSASLGDASSAVKEWQQSMQNARIKHQEYRGDRYVAAVDVSGYEPTHLLYLARAVTPGHYRVPPPLVESMYRPGWKALGSAPKSLVVKGR